MTTFYLDFEGGNDGNAGTSFALRWKTITTGATAARTAPGDTIRVMKSAVATALGQNATWTDGSDTVTLTTAVTADIDDCSSLWTASANVTSTLITTAYKEGAQAINLSIAAAFATGLVGYKATGLLDLSAYQQVSFWVRPSFAFAAGVLQLKLCSDVAGATPVESFDIPALLASHWYRVTVNKGSALNSAVRSVALYAASDPSTNALSIDNIIACKAVGSADSLTLDSLIAPHNVDTDPWYCIHSIRGTTIKLGAFDDCVPPSNGKYYGEASPSATVQATYKREAIPLTALQTVQESGSIGSEITYSCGWDRTAMTTQDGVTWIRPADGSVAAQAGFGLVQGISGLTHVIFDKLYFANVNNSGYSHTAGGNMRFVEVGGAGGKTLLNFGATASRTIGGCIVDNMTFSTGFAQVLTTASSSSYDRFQLRAKKLYYGPTGSTDFSFALLAASSGDTALKAIVDEIKGFNAALWNGNANVFECYNTSFRDNVQDAYNDQGTIYSLIRLINPTFYSGDIALNVSNDGPVEVHGVNGDLTDQRYYQLGTSTGPRVLTATDQRHTAADKSWKFITGNVAEHVKIERVVGRAAVDAGSLVTCTLWAYRDQSYVYGRLVARPFIAGMVGETTVDLTLTSTWEQLSLTFTPTVAGVFELVFQTWATSASAGNVWIDDIGITQ